jgi:hypothetical protein
MNKSKSFSSFGVVNNNSYIRTSRSYGSEFMKTIQIEQNELKKKFKNDLNKILDSMFGQYQGEFGNQLARRIPKRRKNIKYLPRKIFKTSKENVIK